MKKILSFLPALLLSSLLFSQISFKKNIIIENLINSPEGIFAADLDQDEKFDILVASNNDNKISWFKNEGLGNFGSQRIISSVAVGATSVFAIDLDGDGDNDVIYASINDNKIAWHKNNGSGNFGPQIIISTLAINPTSVYSFDIDGDGDNDVLSASFDNKIAWYENNGLGNFGLQQIISTEVFYPFSVYAEDMDGDGDYDILSASVLDNKIAWYENLGSGSFGAQQIITTQTLQARSVFAIDLDGDGDNDVISASSYDHKIAWYENDSTGNFGPQQLISIGNVSAAFNACDLDGDGDIDIIANTLNHGGLIWFENNGFGIFSNSVLIDSLTFTNKICSADFDNNGKKDIAILYGVGNLAWYPNDSLGNFGSKQIITYAIFGPASVFASDLDNDGDKDVIAGGHEITTFINNGDKTFDLDFTISITASDVKEVFAADLDGDGHNDIISIFNTEIVVWYENDSTGSFGTQQIIADSVVAAKTIYSCDLDGDGDNDILMGTVDSQSSTDDEKLLWWKNDGSGNFGPEILIHQGTYGKLDIKTADIDNDGDIDIITSEGRVCFYKNDGFNNFTRHHLSYASSLASKYLDIADLNGDSLIDIVFTSGLSGNNADLAWIKNNGGGSFSNPTILGTFFQPRQVAATDVDLDGDKDIVMEYSSWSNSLIWFANDGAGNFGPQQYITDSVNITTMCVDDFDNDGDIDILYNSLGYDKTLWAENLGYFTIDTDSACANLPYTFGSQVLTVSGTYHDTLQTVFGLDSVIELAFSQLPVPAVGIAPFPQDTFCIQTGAIDFPLVSPPGGSFSGPGVTATNINLNLADTGTHEISYLYTDTSTGCANSDTTHFVVIDCLTIPEATELGVSVYPNPADNFIMVEGKNLPAGDNVQIRLFDVSAKVVHEESPGSFPYKMDIRYLKARGLLFAVVHRRKNGGV